MANPTIRKSIIDSINNSHIRVVEYKKNEIILYQSPNNHDIACVLNGIIYLCIENHDYERNILSIFRSGDCFSPSILLSSDTTTSYFISKCQCQIALFQVEDLKDLPNEHFNESKDLLVSIKEQFTQDLLWQNYILHNKTLRNKLMAYLRRESDYQNSKNLLLPIPYSDLADYLAVDRSAMMKEIAKMKKEQLISGKNHNLALLPGFFQKET